MSLPVPGMRPDGGLFVQRGAGSGGRFTDDFAGQQLIDCSGFQAEFEQDFPSMLSGQRRAACDL
jgi:hypothetical protein